MKWIILVYIIAVTPVDAEQSVRRMEFPVPYADC